MRAWISTSWRFPPSAHVIVLAGFALGAVDEASACAPHPTATSTTADQAPSVASVGPQSSAVSATAPAGSASDASASVGEAGVIAPPVIERPTKPLTPNEARRYMLALVNRDRAAHGLGPVSLDDGAPTAAGQTHAEDMVRLGYLGHWGSDGSVPEQRHTDAGGADMVLENALCFTDEHKRVVDKNARIDPVQVERAESLFFDEVPPNDGHRRNILKAVHTKVGIGVAQSTATATELAVPCFAQEFVDGYGTYDPLPKTAKVGAKVHVAAVLTNGAKPTGIGIARVALPHPLATDDLNKRRSYPVPKPYQMYWGPGFVTPIVIGLVGPKVTGDLPLSDGGQPGLYEISVWAKIGGSDEQTMVSLRTIRVEK